MQGVIRAFVPGLLHRRLLRALPAELGTYVLAAKRTVNLSVDLALVGPSLMVLDADVGFEIRGPSKSAKDARKQALRFNAAREARRLLGARFAYLVASWRFLDTFCIN